jgi:hypothetical protein
MRVKEVKTLQGSSMLFLQFETQPLRCLSRAVMPTVRTLIRVDRAKGVLPFLGGLHNEFADARKNCALYRNWVQPRQDSGLPFSLADLLRAVSKSTKLAIPIEELASALGVSVGYVEMLNNALAEGVSEQELSDMNDIRVQQKTG